ncbi:hypothetical protein HZS_5731 [Henneguya salminicola]|nr:hypothetical protein HZS_5731 [Henneguya salminicola]
MILSIELLLLCGTMKLSHYFYALLLAFPLVILFNCINLKYKFCALNILDSLLHFRYHSKKSSLPPPKRMQDNIKSAYNIEPREM